MIKQDNENQEQKPIASFLKNPNNNQKIEKNINSDLLPQHNKIEKTTKAKSASEYYAKIGGTQTPTQPAQTPTAPTAPQNKTTPFKKKSRYPSFTNKNKKVETSEIKKPMPQASTLPRQSHQPTQALPQHPTATFQKEQPNKPFKKPMPRSNFSQNKQTPTQPPVHFKKQLKKPIDQKPAAGLLANAKPAIASTTPFQKQPTENGATVRIIPLGGLNEIGKNMTVYECMGDMFIVDCGMAFPDADMLGVDLVIPDFSFIEKNIDKVKGLCITHGHEDHIGGIPFLLKKFDIPIYASPLALGLIQGKLKEHGLTSKARLHIVTPTQTVKMGCMTVEFLRVNHSIPDAMACAIHTPAGVILQTGDFKIDFSPIEGDVIDLARFAELGSQGLLCLLSDSTNAERKGSTMSERKVGQSFQNLFNNAEGKRIIIASFASNIHRIQQIITIAEKFGRKVAVSGRSMENVVAIAIELGYLTVPEGLLVDIDAIAHFPR
ncbi:MAG: MBL fold metallo-hydrolase, partial [Oscillospiraceae bacterium]